MSKDSTFVEDCRSAVERISASKHLRKSPRLRDFLCYVSDRALLGRPDEATEAQIGIHIFGRQPGYNSSEDSIVRVSARQLRQKLIAYYSDEGAADEIRIEIPKGSYLPDFQRRDPAAVHEIVVSRARARQRWVLSALILVVVVIAVSGLVLALLPSHPARQTTLVSILLGEGQPVRLIMSDAGLIPLDRLTGKKTLLDEYSRKSYYIPGPGQDGDEGKRRAITHLIRAPHVGMADLNFLVGVFRNNPENLDRILVSHSRELTAREAKSDNLWLLGGGGVIPWTSLFAGEFSLHIEMPEGDTGARSSGLNAPAASAMETAYAHVALLRLDGGKRHVMLLEGTTMPAKEAAGEFVTSARGLAEIRRGLRLGPSQPIPAFEAILKTYTVEAVPTRWEVDRIVRR
ncbi:MAG: hypothetical protein HY821_17830 [Acidobacteria bacterium]|nr:hypothetical protein [Acidobacteriota bacterium]